MMAPLLLHLGLTLVGQWLAIKSRCSDALPDRLERSCHKACVTVSTPSNDLKAAAHVQLASVPNPLEDSAD